jgi:ATP-dependent Clp protease ATP-binding subunit ClpB
MGTQKVSREQIMRVLQDNFKPEFLNRIDEIIIFHKLEKEQLGKIVSIQLKRVEKLLLNADTFWKFRLPRVEYLTEVGDDADFGARPLKRVIQHELQDPLDEAAEW